MSTVFKAKISKVLDAAEDPRETLDYSYQKQLELLQKVKRGLADVITSKKRLELQVIKLKDRLTQLEDQARKALAAGREDLAATILERKQAAQKQLEDLNRQVAELEKEQENLAATETRLSAKVEAFRTQKEVVKARYSAAEAQVKIGEATTGISEEMADVGMALERARDKTENMRARAAAIEELTDEGILDGFLEEKDDITRELDRFSAAQNVQAELQRLKKEMQQEGVQ
jgi:phage shock protein A